MNSLNKTNSAIFSQIHEGMSVYDLNEDKIGTVSYIQMTDENPNQPGPETATPSEMREPGEGSLVREVAEAFVDDELPEEVQRKLLREGYLRVDIGILRADRFVTPDQISHVSDENVYLSVMSDDLIRR